MQKYTLYYDDDCGFCQNCVSWIHRLDWFSRIALNPLQGHLTALSQQFQIPEDRLMEALQLVSGSEGQQLDSGFFAVRRILWLFPVGWLCIPLFYFPGANIFGPKLYQWVAKNRHSVCKPSYL